MKIEEAEKNILRFKIQRQDSEITDHRFVTEIKELNEFHLDC